jgi:hypothetical protein
MSRSLEALGAVKEPHLSEYPISVFCSGAGDEYWQDPVCPTHGFPARTTFTRIVDRYDGNRRVRIFTCAEHCRAMALAQLTYRESLRDIEACLSAQAHELYHMGFRGPARRSTLADANETRGWRIYAEFAQRLIARARKLYAQDDLGLELSNTVYALDSTSSRLRGASPIDLCLSVFPGSPYRSMCSSPSSRNGSDWRPRSTLCHRFCRSLYSRTCHCDRHLQQSSTKPTTWIPITNWIYSIY